MAEQGYNITPYIYCLYGFIALMEGIEGKYCGLHVVHMTQNP